MATSPTNKLACLYVDGKPNDADTCVRWLSVDELPDGEVLIDVTASSLNYKDALACQANPGVVASLPHIPGIDCAGTVLESSADEFSPGDEILVTGYGLGSDTWGGFAQRVRVPADWVVRLPETLSRRQAMTYGTAGFTAAQCVMGLLRNGATPERGPYLVTGATGGVGIFAVAILAKLGFEVVAMTGKAELGDRLVELGASRIVDRDALGDSSKPLLSESWAGGVDTVGGDILSALLRSTKHRGAVSACGLVAGHELPLTVYPFILRGVTLVGIDSAKCPREPRLEVWDKLAGDWRVDLPDDLVTEVTLDEVSERVEEMLRGRTFGRTLVLPKTTTTP